MKKNIAVIGCGYWGKNLIRNFYELGALLAIYDVDKKQSFSLKEKYPDVLVGSSLETVLNDSRIQGVVISTPAATHYSLAKLALSADKDVFVEKPSSLHYEEGEELVVIAKKKKRLFPLKPWPGLWYRQQLLKKVVRLALK